MRRLLLPFLLVGLCACGSAPEPEEAPLRTTSTGGESPEPAVEEGEPEPAAPVVMRMTVPVPVPQPAVPRDELSPELEAVWAHVEEQVQMNRPAGPEENTVDTVRVWAEGPFQEWVDQRRAALEHTRTLVGQVEPEPPYERAMALALFAYAFEDFGAQIGGSPVPDEIANDEELRGIYIESLNRATLPLGERIIEFYADCQTRLESLGDNSPWLPWRAHCVQRGQAVIEGYGLSPAAAPAPQEEPERAAPESNPSDL